MGSIPTPGTNKTACLSEMRPVSPIYRFDSSVAGASELMIVLSVPGGKIGVKTLPGIREAIDEQRLWPLPPARPSRRQRRPTLGRSDGQLGINTGITLFPWRR